MADQTDIGKAEAAARKIAIAKELKDGKEANALSVKEGKADRKEAREQKKVDDKAFSEMTAAQQKAVNDVIISENKKADDERRAADAVAATELAASIKDDEEQYVAKKVEISYSAALAKELSSKKEDVTKEVEIIDLGKQIKKLAGTMGMDATEESKALQAEFKNLSIQLENPDLDPLEKEVLEGELQNLGLATNDEEERREKQEAVDENASLMKRMGDGIQNFGDSFDKFASGMAVGGGIIAALGVIAMMFLDPETLMEGITWALQKVKDIIDAIKEGIENGWDAGFTAMEGHMGTVAAIIGGIVLLFGGTIIRALGTVFKMVGGLAGTVVKFAQAIMWIGRGLWAMAAMAGSAFMTAISAVMAPIIALLGIPLTIALGVGLVFAAIGYGLYKLKEALGFDGVMDTIFFALKWVQDGLAGLYNLFVDLANMIMGLVNKFGKWLGFEFDMPVMERAATNNAEVFKADVLQRQAEEKAEAQKAEGLAAEEAAETKKLEQQDNLTTTTTMTNDMKVDQMNSMNTQDSSSFDMALLGGDSDFDLAMDGSSPFDDAISGSGTPSAERLEAEQAQLTKTQALVDAAAQPSNTVMSNSSTSNDNSARTYVQHNTVVKPSRDLYSPAW